MHPVAEIDVRNMDSKVDAALGRALEDLGIVVIEGHGISEKLIRDAYRVSGKAFDLPLQIKQRYERPQNGRQTGYIPFGAEKARGAKTPDLKESWSIARPGEGDSLFPHEVPGFESIMPELFAQMEQLSKKLLGSIGRFLKRPPMFFETWIANSDRTTLRMLYYKETCETVEGQRAAPQRDSNLLSLLVGASPGLQVVDRDGFWVTVRCPSSAVIVMVGDSMWAHTMGRLRFAEYQVENPSVPDGGRYSFALFTHPRDDFPVVTAADMVNHRLQEMGLF